MAGKEAARGPTGDTVAARLREVRTNLNLTYTEVSERLAAAEWPISAVGVRRIEDGERRVTVDDLVSLSAALGVSPVTLLMPITDSGESTSSSTGCRQPVAAEELWRWLRADAPLPGDSRLMVVFRSEAWPEWRFREYIEVEEEARRLSQAAWLRARRAQKKLATMESEDGDD